jgi:hypothetical protein
MIFAVAATRSSIHADFPKPEEVLYDTMTGTLEIGFFVFGKFTT